MHHDHRCRIARQRAELLSERSMLALAISDALTSCRRAAAAPRRRDAQAALVLATAVALAGAGLPARAQQQPVNWTGAESSDWFTPGNWSNGFPTNGTNVVIDTTQHDPEISGGNAFASTLTVGQSSDGALTISGGGTLSSFRGEIGDGRGEGAVTVTGPGSRWSTTGYDVFVGAGAGSTGRIAIENGGAVEVKRDVVIGSGSGSIGQVTVEGAGSRLFAESDIALGLAMSSTGTLVIQDGGQARSNSGTFGFNSDSVGKAMVTGVGSSWSISHQLMVGVSGNGTLLVEAGGKIDNQHAFIGNDAGSVGKVTVTGADSTWTSDGALYVGDAGAGTLEILDGGTVSNHDGVIGNAAGSVGKATVAGSGSTWINAGTLTIGWEGQGLLQVLDGGLVESASASINSGTLPDGGVEVIGSDSTWINAGGLLVGEISLGSMEVLDGGLVESASVSLGSATGSEGQVRVNGFDAGGVSSRLGITGNLLVGDAGTGKLLVDNAGVLDNQDGIIGNSADSTDSRALVTGTGSTWTNRGALSVGNGGQGILEVLDGGYVESASGSIGSAEGSDGKVRVSGVDSAGIHASWEIDAGNLAIGDAGSGLLLVEAGGAVRNQHGFIGNEEGSVGEVTVTGEGSAWINDHGLWVGNAGSGALEILDGGVVGSMEAVVANVGDGAVLVDGDGSRWDIGGALVIGNFGLGEVTIRDGGGVTSTFGIVGNQSDVQSTMRVQGTGSAWTGLDDLYVGFAGNGALAIEDGGRVESTEGTIGSEAGSIGDVVVSGAGSAWANTFSLVVGLDGVGTLSILDGGSVASEYSVIGSGEGSQGDVQVLGAGSNWLGTGLIRVGGLGNGRLAIRDGGRVTHTQGYIAGGPGSIGNVAVTGTDPAGNSSSWTLSSELFVGSEGTGTLAIEDGGAVSSTDGYIGRHTDSIGEATVNGAGSQWNNSGGLTVGRSGSGELVIEAGGNVTSAYGALGVSAGSQGRVMVTGAGSAWNMSGWGLSSGMDVGLGGIGELIIADGGVVSVDSSDYANRMIGVAEEATGTVIVTGAGSEWIGNTSLNVGYRGTGTLMVESGGHVSSAFSFIGQYDQGSGTVIVRGTGSQWNTDNLYVGYEGSGVLDILDGGVVSTGGTGVLGDQTDAVGVATVDGQGSAWNIGGDLALGGYYGSGDLTVANGGSVAVAGMLGMALQPDSTGTLNIGAAAGEAAVAAGTVEADLVRFTSITAGYAGNGTINFNHTNDDYTFAVAIEGIGTVNTWSGTTRLTGESTYTGATNVNAGTLLVEGSLGDTVTTVADGATLGGSGSIAGDVTIADGGVLAPGSSAGTLTVGSLSLSSGSTLDYELGQAGAIGGGVNDLIEVTGNLTLDGTLDITDIGGFGAGVYRLINYGGDLIDNGLEIGARPVDTDTNDLSVLTTYDGQVNLASTAGLTLGFWDGAMSPDNSAIDGGDGSWNADNSSWTTADGDMNGRWDDGTFAVFGGTAGNVEVVGEQNIAGLQFMSGYTLAAGTDGALRIDNAESVIRVDPDVTATIAAPIIGAGGLIKTDTGTLVLLGENSYEGGTRVDLGTLQVASDSNLGDVAGGLAFDGGTLQTTAAFDSARDVNLQADGGTFLTDANLGLGGVISGAGTLTKNGAGTLTLAGANTYAGGTRVLEGTLVGDAGSIRGNLDNDGSVVFDQADDGTFAGTISGDGTLAKRGAGELTLTGNSALAWSIDAGALVATGGFIGDAGIADGARLRLEQAGDATYAGVLSGAGGLESGGSGTLVLTSDSSAFAGSTGVDAGTLQVDGALGGSVEVGTGAALAGDGTLGGAVSILDGGRLAPGAGVGTLTMGTLWLSEGATLDYELGQAGAIGGDANDLLEVAGDLTLDGTLAITDVGGFGAGVYRLINYGGVLTDNTLDLGALPDGFEADDLFLQTAVDGQVNLVNSAGVVLGFWDGGAGPTDDGNIQGGDGTWTGSDRSWTDANGAINGDWGAGFAVFGGEAGTVTVEGTQAFTGLQFMTDGYRITGDALAMDTAQTIVRVDRDVTATIESSLTGSGALVKHDAGTLVLSGENSYVGGTQLLGGVLAVGADTNLGAADGALAFDGGALRIDAGFDSVRDINVGDQGGAFDSGAFDITWAGDFSGDGTFTRIGSGTLTLVGASHGFAGTFALQSGGLRVDGNLGGTLAIANGALLTGIGTLHDIDNHGTVAAGHSIGTLTLTGDYIHRDDATLLAEIEPGGASDLLDVAGSATLEGGAVQVVKLPGQYEGGTRYTLIDAAGGVNGTFDTLDQDLPFLDLLLGYDANHVYLDVQRNEVDFDIVCGDGTFNQCQVAGALDAIGHDHPIPGDLETMLAEVTSLTLPGAQAAFDRLSGEAHGSLAGILLEGHAMYGQAVSRRIAERRDQTGTDRLHGGAWVRAYGNSSDLDGDGNAHAADFEQRGLAVGFDAWGDEHWLVGASFNAMNIDADFRPGDRGEADAKNASLYATFEGEHAYLDVVTSFAWWDNEITRAIVVGDIDRQARSTYGGHRFATHFEAGWNFALGERQQLTPLVSVEYAKLDQEGFREEGAGDLNLIGRSQDVERTTVTAGLRWSTAFESGDWTFEPTVQARWLHALGDEHAEQDVAFAGAPGIGYRVRGLGWPQDRGLVGVGLQLRHGDNLDLFVDVDYQKGGGLEAKNLGAGLRWRW